MDFAFTPEQETFRVEVRRFLEGEIKLGSFAPGCDAWIIGHSPEFSRKIAAKGWIGLVWPKEYGGQGKTYIDRLVLTEELLRYGAPVASHWFSDRQMGTAILAYGTPEQKAELLPQIIRAEVFFGIGMSEPGAGSDLASLQCRAQEQDDCYVLNGQKVWTSGAHAFTHLYLVARTDPDAPKHKGISELIVPMDLPGITINPIVDLTGHKHFNEVFFDNVRLPKKYLVGQKNRGWYQIASQLDFERSGIERLMSNYALFQSLFEYARQTKRDGRPLSQDPIIRHRLAQLAIEFEVGRLLIYRVACVLSQGKAPNFEAALAKTFCTHFEQKLACEATQILGHYGTLLASSRRVPFSGYATSSYLFSPGYTIQGGTSEILKNIIALRGLGLPSE
ncbi:MAG: Acyl-CoA dehydrogenase [Dehalococcoidia bacterium]|nr:Acyl-CoA dehydrogenase [Dehalococcoidia bacterium]